MYALHLMRCFDSPGARFAAMDGSMRLGHQARCRSIDSIMRGAESQPERLARIPNFHLTHSGTEVCSLYALRPRIQIAIEPICSAII